jgi:hypothetical protein
MSPSRLATLLGALCAACPAYALSHPGARPGEAFTYRFSVGPVESGRARMSVGPVATRGGRHVLAVHGQAESAPWLSIFARVNDDYQLLLDAATLLPRSVVTVESGFRERRIATQLDGRAIDIEVRARKEGGRAKRVLPRLARDPLSSLFLLRAAPLRPGDALEFDVIDGPALWRCTLWVRARETVRLESDAPGSAARPAIRVDGELRRIDDGGRPVPIPTRHLNCWLSDDGDRVLLRSSLDTDLGRASIELTSFDRPPRRTDERPQLAGVVLRASP